MSTDHTNWYELLLEQMIRDFGQRRAVADHRQIAHMAHILSLLDDRIPGSYPQPVAQQQALNVDASDVS